MSGHALAQPQNVSTPQEKAANVDTVSLQHRYTNQAEPITLPKRLFDVAPGTFAEPRFGYDFSQVPAHTDMVQQMAPLLRTRTMVQCYPANEDASSTPAPEATQTTEPEEESAALEETMAPALLVEDSVTELAPGQMRKSEFLAQLRAEVTRTAESAMAGTGRTTADCPYLDYWFGYYSAQDVQHGERALRRYAPEVSSVTSAREYIPVIAQRVRRSVETWVRTGEVTGVPEGLPRMGLLGSIGSLVSGIGSIFRKARNGGTRKSGDPRVIRAQLGSGQPLGSGVRSRMESAFGRDFSHVRTHTDTTANGLSKRFNARAFTVGEHVAFGSGEYRPGTLVGDALIAHEMAHVVQQSGASASVAPMQTGETGYNMLENDADKSALGAVASLWGSAKGKLADIAQNVMPRLRSGLSLQRCQKETRSEGEKSISVDMVKLRGSTRTPSTDLTTANKIYKKCCVKFTEGKNEPVPNKLSDIWLRSDTDLDRSAGKGCGKVGGEEKAMFDGATAEYKLSSRMRVFYVETFNPDGLAYSIPPYCATGAEKPYVNHVVVKNAALKDTLAHEFGHILLNSGDHKSIDNPSDTSNLMYAPGRTGSDIDKSQCKIISNNS